MRPNLEQLKKEFQESHTTEMIKKYCPMAKIMLSTLISIMTNFYLQGRIDEQSVYIERTEKELKKLKDEKNR